MCVWACLYDTEREEFTYRCNAFQWEWFRVCVCWTGLFAACSVLYYDHFQVNRKVIELRIAKKPISFEHLTIFIENRSTDTEPTISHRQNIKGQRIYDVRFSLHCVSKLKWILLRVLLTLSISFCISSVFDFCITFSLLINSWQIRIRSHTLLIWILSHFSDDMKNCWFLHWWRHGKRGNEIVIFISHHTVRELHSLVSQMMWQLLADDWVGWNIFFFKSKLNDPTV